MSKILSISKIFPMERIGTPHSDEKDISPPTTTLPLNIFFQCSFMSFVPAGDSDSVYRGGSFGDTDVTD